jgi:hypothetical protein
MDALPADGTGLVTLTERHEQSVRSAGADVRVGFERHAFCKSGSSPVTGPIARLRADAIALGLTNEQIAVDHVRTESQGWGVVGAAAAAAVLVLAFTRDPAIAGLVAAVPLVLRLVGLLDWPYRSTCTMRFRANDPEQTRKLVDLVVATPRAVLSGVDWSFAAAEPSPAWVDECLHRANERAKRIAHALGAEILGVHEYAERWRLPSGDVEPAALASGMAALGPAVRETDRGPSFATDGEAGVVVTVAYRVGRRAAA